MGKRVKTHENIDNKNERDVYILIDCTCLFSSSATLVLYILYMLMYYICIYINRLYLSFFFFSCYFGIPVLYILYMLMYYICININRLYLSSSSADCGIWKGRGLETLETPCNGVEDGRFFCTRGESKVGDGIGNVCL